MYSFVDTQNVMAILAHLGLIFRWFYLGAVMIFDLSASVMIKNSANGLRINNAY